MILRTADNMEIPVTKQLFNVPPDIRNSIQFYCIIKKNKINSTEHWFLSRLTFVIF